MTTIACDMVSMAGDGLQTIGSTIVGERATKVYRLKDGRLYGSCGTEADGPIYAAWLEAGGKGDPPKLSDDFGCLVLSPGGTVQSGGESGRLVEVDAPAALGSGMDLALGAMEAGKPAGEALIIAARRDRSTGGRITVLFLEPEGASAR